MKQESTQRVQTAAKDFFFVLFLAVYRNHNSKQGILLKFVDSYCDLDRHKI